ncbi:hypothetical protein ACH5RR_009076 [Cinchona calisaya]|uniref:Uncharacterized protein n=1 Tax=Cinchona calisaya TaxID=153742 RepID=A0ABD3ADD7_9GENT
MYVDLIQSPAISEILLCVTVSSLVSSYDFGNFHLFQSPFAVHVRCRQTKDSKDVNSEELSFCGNGCQKVSKRKILGISLSLIIINMAAIMEKADENLLPSVYKEVSEAFSAGQSDLGYLTFIRNFVQ